MNDKIIFNIKETTIDKLLKYHKPETINGFCKSCPKYSRVWTCPPLSINETDYLSSYKYCYIISGKIYINSLSDNEKNQLIEHTFNKFDDIIVAEDKYSKIFNGIYYAFREETDLKMLELEGYFTGSKVLTSGRCLICKKCSRFYGKPCIFPEKLRYSLESLGIDVMAVTNEILEEKIDWSSDQIPECVTGISALLSHGRISPDAILSRLTPNKK